jgi:hypothetical protein
MAGVKDALEKLRIKDEEAREAVARKIGRRCRHCGRLLQSDELVSDCCAECDATHSRPSTN